jgi:hypothetical protein
MQLLRTSAAAAAQPFDNAFRRRFWSVLRFFRVAEASGEASPGSLQAPPG